MKVKVIFTGAYPIGNVTAHRVHNICKGLIANKAEVEVLPRAGSSEEKKRSTHI